MFRAKIREHAERVAQNLDKHPGIGNIEQQTKDTLIRPFFECLGYDPNDPGQVMPEAAIDAGKKKVDYMLTGKGSVKIAVEAKPANTTLSAADIQQLREYFTFSKAVVGILTNGVRYWLFTDLATTHLMDSEPYHRVNIKNPEDITDNDIHHLETLTRSRVQQSAIREQAQREQYRKLVNEIVDQELGSPSQEFLRMIGRKAGISPLRKAHLKLLAPLVKKAIRRNRESPPPDPCSPGSNDPWPSVYPGYSPGNLRTEPTLKGVTLLGRTLLAKNYTHMLCLVVAVLQSQHRGDFAERVSKEPFFKDARTRQYISKDTKDFDPKYPEDRRKVGEYFVAVGLNAVAKVRRARLFLSAFGHDPDELVIHTSD